MSQSSKQSLKEMIKKLSQINAGAGMEQPMVRAVIEEISPYVDEVFVDARGSVYAKKTGAAPGHTLMLAAHMDQIGMIVKNILPNGYILFEKNGDVPNNLLLGRKVFIGNKNIPGVVGCKPGHLQTPEEASKVPIPEQCYIDAGFASRQEAEAQGIGIGDQVIWQSDFMEFANPDRVCSKALDNRVNCAILIEFMRTLEKEAFKGTIYAVFTVLEEVGLYGAMMGAYRLEPDYAVALDTIPAGDTPDVMAELLLPIYLGRGPAMSLADGVMSSIYYHVVHPAVRRMIETQAAAASINLQKCTITGGRYATDASKLSYAGKGVPCAVLAVPRRYSHSPIEVMDMNDAMGSLAILQGIARDNAEQDLSFLQDGGLLSR
ncbi:M20/M25/M40 family metallo-hydrolase [Eubacteriales bacterium OttesenSCG-928-K08]|nr:M20/M25/M40 family metallo-hydrolase [Eubacteriales bacterium OttesenSCG-928-K08]